MDEIEKLREELAEANARRADYAARSGRFAEQADRLQRERDEAIKARDQYLRERDQARLAEERARESLDELDEAIYEYLPSDDDDAPLDCVEHAADQLRALAQERDEARAAAFAEAIAVVNGATDYNHGFPPHLDAIHEGVRFAALVLEKHVANADAHQNSAVRAMGVAQIIRERDEARAEVERMKERMVDHAAKFEAGTKAFRNMAAEAVVDARDAYRRGAEAMREACAVCVGSDPELRKTYRSHALESRVRALPIPEEP